MVEATGIQPDEDGSTPIPPLYSYAVILWGFGANSIGLSFPYDRVRCSNCRRWTRSPASYELDRELCARCHVERSLPARRILFGASTS